MLDYPRPRPPYLRPNPGKNSSSHNKIVEVGTIKDQYDVVDTVDGWDAIGLPPMVAFSPATNADTTIKMMEIA